MCCFGDPEPRRKMYATNNPGWCPPGGGGPYQRHPGAGRPNIRPNQGRQDPYNRQPPMAYQNAGLARPAPTACHHRERERGRGNLNPIYEQRAPLPPYARNDPYKAPALQATARPGGAFRLSRPFSIGDIFAVEQVPHHEERLPQQQPARNCSRSQPRQQLLQPMRNKSRRGRGQERQGARREPAHLRNPSAFESPPPLPGRRKALPSASQDERHGEGYWALNKNAEGGRQGTWWG
ncbi:hypothetical protein MMC21_004684 [Puttea exsequens]|nr:hypothetical protein [Puttea exsequens]